MSDTTDEQFINAVRDVVKGNEDFVYTKVESVDNSGDESTCRYIDHEGKPSCLIGQALFKCGIVVPEDLEGKRANALLKQLTSLSYSVRYAADLAQGEQDSGNTWGEALSEFEIALSNDNPDSE